MRPSQEHEIVPAIRDWLAATAELEVAIGLPREEAQRRARALLAAIMSDGLGPDDVDTNDADLNDILWALAEHLEEKPLGSLTFQECDRAYRFVAALSVEDGPFEEVDGVLSCLARIGWRSSPVGLEAVIQARAAVWIDGDERERRESWERECQLFSRARGLRRSREHGSSPEEDRSEGSCEENLSSYDALLTTCKALLLMFESGPAVAASKAAALYRWAMDSAPSTSLLDEREHLLGATALITAKASRLIGKLTDAERWLDRADVAIRRTLKPAPSIARIDFERLALRFSSGRFEETLELLPSLKLRFEKFGMDLENAKTQFMEACALRDVGRVDEHFALLQGLEEASHVRSCPSLHGQILVHIGNHEATLGDFEAATRTYEKALPIVMRGNRPVALCELKWSIGDTYRAQGSLVRAVDAFRDVRNDYAELGFRAFVTKLSLVIAESLLALGKDREAEREILSALPTIEEEGMVAEGFAAIALLRESVSRRKTDANALRLVREGLQVGK